MFVFTIYVSILFLNLLSHCHWHEWYYIDILWFLYTFLKKGFHSLLSNNENSLAKQKKSLHRPSSRLMVRKTWKTVHKKYCLLGTTKVCLMGTHLGSLLQFWLVLTFHQLLVVLDPSLASLRLGNWQEAMFLDLSWHVAPVQHPCFLHTSLSNCKGN